MRITRLSSCGKFTCFDVISARAVNLHIEVFMIEFDIPNNYLSWKKISNLCSTDAVHQLLNGNSQGTQIFEGNCGEENIFFCFSFSFSFLFFFFYNSTAFSATIPRRICDRPISAYIDRFIITFSIDLSLPIRSSLYPTLGLVFKLQVANF